MRMVVRRAAVVAAAAVAFVVGALWYSPLLFAGPVTRWRGLEGTAAAASEVPVGMLLGEVARCLVAAYVLARLVELTGASDWKSAARLVFWIWLGFPVTLLAGSVLWERVPWQLAAVHSGDWLVKTALMTAVYLAWPGGRAEA